MIPRPTTPAVPEGGGGKAAAINQLLDGPVEHVVVYRPKQPLRFVLIDEVAYIHERQGEHLMAIKMRRTIRLGPVRLHFTERGYSSWSLKIGPWSKNGDYGAVCGPCGLVEITWLDHGDWATGPDGVVRCPDCEGTRQCDQRGHHLWSHWAVVEWEPPAMASRFCGCCPAYARAPVEEVGLAQQAADGWPRVRRHREAKRRLLHEARTP